MLHLPPYLKFSNDCPANIVRNKVMLIRKANITNLTDENKLLELVEEFSKVYDSPIWYAGTLRMIQNMKEFTKYLLFLSQCSNIKSYIEIGAKEGGTFVLTVEYLRAIHNLEKAVICDIESPKIGVIEYKKYFDFEYRTCDSRGDYFKNSIKNEVYDYCFIDGDHEYSTVKSDYNTMMSHAKIIGFHDIICKSCPGVVKFWPEISQQKIFEHTNSKLGIGIVPGNYPYKLEL